MTQESSCWVHPRLIGNPRNHHDLCWTLSEYPQGTSWWWCWHTYEEGHCTLDSEQPCPLAEIDITTLEINSRRYTSLFPISNFFTKFISSKLIPPLTCLPVSKLYTNAYLIAWTLMHKTTDMHRWLRLLMHKRTISKSLSLPYKQNRQNRISSYPGIT